MATKKRFSGSRQPADILTTTSSSSLSDDHETVVANESSNGQKSKKYVKKKGETRKRDSISIGASSTVIQESMEINEITEGLGDVKIIEKRGKGSLTTINNNLRAVESKMGIKRDGEISANETKKDDCGVAEKMGELSPIISKSMLSNNYKDQKNNVQGLKKGDEKGKTAEERRRERNTARFAKAVARFSMKFMKAARDLGIFEPENRSSSDSESSSSSTESSSSCSSSCTCSDCCTTESSTCSCSYCNSSQENSTSSSSPSTFDDSSFTSTTATSETSFSSTTSSNTSSSKSSTSFARIKNSQKSNRVSKCCK